MVLGGPLASYPLVRYHEASCPLNQDRLASCPVSCQASCQEGLLSFEPYLVALVLLYLALGTLVLKLALGTLVYHLALLEFLGSQELKAFQLQVVWALLERPCREEEWQGELVDSLWLDLEREPREKQGWQGEHRGLRCRPLFVAPSCSEGKTLWLRVVS